MRFTLVKDLRSDPLMRPILSVLLLFICLFLISDILLKYERVGLDFTALSNTLYGNEEEFVDPIDEQFFIELLHGDIFFMMMTLLTLSAIYVRVAPVKKRAVIVVNVVTIAAITEIIAFVLAYYAGSFFIPLWIGSFWLWHSGALFMALFSLIRLNMKGSGGC